MTDTYKILGQVESTADSVVSLYSVPSGKQAVSSSLSVVNTGSSLASYSLFAVPGSEYDSIVLTNGSAWAQLGQDIDGEAAGDNSGRVSISADGLRVAIGAPYNEASGVYAGHVRIYEWSGSAWAQLGQDIDGEAAGDNSGISVSISADGLRVAIGAFAASTYTGHVRVYEWSGSAWVKLGPDIVGEDVYNFSGVSVSISADGSRVAIGATENSNPSNGYGGHVRVYEYYAPFMEWMQLGADIDGEAAGDNSGQVSISADGSRVAIGAPYNDASGSDAGHVRIYEWSGSAWAQLGQDIDGEAAGDNSGISVSISADGLRVAIGAFAASTYTGHVRVYEWSGSAWVQLGADIDGEDVYNSSGRVSISANGSRVAIGAVGASTYAGHVRVYEWSGSAWVKLGQDIVGEAANDNSGTSVSISADGLRVAIGAPYNDASNSDAGHVRIYDLLSAGSVIVPQSKHALIKSKAIEAGEHHVVSGGITVSLESQILFSSNTDSLVASIFGVEIQ